MPQVTGDSHGSQPSRFRPFGFRLPASGSRLPMAGMPTPEWLMPRWPSPVTRGCHCILPPSSMQSSSHFRWRVAAPGGRWRAICHLSSVIDAVIDSVLYSALHSALNAVLNSALPLPLSVRQPPTANRHYLSSITPSSHPQSSPASPPRARSLLGRVSRRR